MLHSSPPERRGDANARFEPANRVSSARTASRLSRLAIAIPSFRSLTFRATRRRSASSPFVSTFGALESSRDGSRWLVSIRSISLARAREVASSPVACDRVYVSPINGETDDVTRRPPTHFNSNSRHKSAGAFTSPRNHKTPRGTSGPRHKFNMKLP